VERARVGGGPAFLLTNTYRYTGHHVGDISREYYRSKQEEQTWKTERDPIRNFARWVIEQKIAEPAQLAQIESELTEEMDKAVEFAVAAPYPKPEEAEQDVYA
jgi:pyruvate dehydrogenase E1 component alpha subunit